MPEADADARPHPGRADAPLGASAHADGARGAVHAPARHLQLPRPPDLDPVQSPSRPRRQRRDQQYRRRGPRVPGDDRRAVAGLHAGGGRVPFSVAQPLMRTGVPPVSARGERRPGWRTALYEGVVGGPIRAAICSAALGGTERVAPGKLTRIDRPPPAGSSVVIVASWASAIPFTIESPRPSPWAAVIREPSRRWKGSNSRSRSSAGIVGPVLVTRSIAWPFVVRVVTSIRPASWLCWT